MLLCSVECPCHQTRRLLGKTIVFFLNDYSPCANPLRRSIKDEDSQEDSEESEESEESSESQDKDEAPKFQKKGRK